jgi:hypothetical protein
MATLIIIPCGIQKIWKKHPDAGPTKAKDAYTGSPFVVNKKYAEKFSEHWVILSAKYGFIEPDFIIEKTYNVTFNNPKTNPISQEELKKQVADKLSGFDRIVALGGKMYTDIVESVFNTRRISLITPVRGYPIPKSNKIIAEAVRNNTPFQ